MFKMNNALKFQIGIIIESQVIPAWIYSMIEKITELDIGQITVITTEFVNERNSILFRLFNKFENQKKINQNAYEKKEAKNLEKSKKINIPRNEVSKYVEKNYSNYDIIINFVDVEIKTEKYPKFGIWKINSYQEYSNILTNGFWEVLNKIPFSTIRLESIFNNNRYLLGKYFTKSDLLSVKRTSNMIAWGNFNIILNTLKRIQKNPTEIFNQLNEESNKVKMPKNGDYLKIILLVLIRTIKFRIVKKLFFEQWVILFKLGDKSTSLKNFKYIFPKSGMLADPIVVVKNEKYFVFVEESEKMDKKGHISIIEIDKNGKNSEPEKILELPYHVSYPYVFEYNKKYFMIPESHENKTIQIFKCDKFPKEWSLEQVIMENIDAVDTTLFEFNNKWWLFTSVRQNNSLFHDELFIFYSDNPISQKWISHPMNPILSDIRKARQAGRIFHKDGKIFRPAQDGSISYGHRIIINEITVLNEEKYEEKIVDIIEPSTSKITGIHTYSFDEKITLLDARIKKLKISK